MTQWINGIWLSGSGAEFSSQDPATGSVIWSGRSATLADVDAAVSAARAALPVWSALQLDARIEVLQRFADLLRARKDDLAMAISKDTGKVLWDAAGEAAAMAGKIDISIRAYHERTPTRTDDSGAMRTRITHRPHGVMAVFGPYNFPGHLPNGHIVPALLAGNTVVFKPSELTPMVGEFACKLWAEAGLPAGVINLVQGARETGEALVAHPDINGVLFTGSVPTGRAIARALVDRPEVITALELGGNNPLIAHDIADTDAAVGIIINSAFITSGQRCTCARRLIVPQGAAGDALVTRLVEATAGITVGAAGDEVPAFMGPLISDGAARHVIAAQQALLDAGATALLSARLLDRGPAFVSPGIVDVTAVEARADEEVFGPLLQVIRVADVDAAIREANNTRFGLASGLLSDSRELYQQFYASARAGIVNWNQQLTGASSGAPFGGTGLSGNYRPSAYYAADYVAYAMASIEQPADKVTLVSWPVGVAPLKD